jgi:8-oxo-dGTP pyrophosphatase MutT (NUDIX family)
MLCSELKKSKQEKKFQFSLVAKYTGQKKSLFNYIDSLEKAKEPKNILIYHPDFKKLKQDFLALYQIVIAGGGVVINEKKEILFIFRRGSWDLPKGKIDSGETIKEAAIREVMEETGISNVRIVEKLGKTNHYFPCKFHKRCIKKSYWYIMESPSQNLVPQRSEDIEIAVWLPLSKFYSKKRKVYRSILEVLRKLEKRLS